MDMEAPAFPCGLVAKSLFNDTFTLYKGNETDAANQIKINTEDIAWESDKENKFKNLPYEEMQKKQWTDIEKGKSYYSSHDSKQGD